VDSSAQPIQTTTTTNLLMASIPFQYTLDKLVQCQAMLDFAAATCQQMTEIHCMALVPTETVQSSSHHHHQYTDTQFLYRPNALPNAQT